MPILTGVGREILSEGGAKNSRVYRGILEIFGVFGYASIEEVMYGFDLSLQEAVNRLAYLERAGFIQRFPSRATPESFFFLTTLGRQAAAAHAITTSPVFPFYPSKYAVGLQYHHRTIIKAFLALRKIFNDDFLGWTTEKMLRKNWDGLNGHGEARRVLDGEFLLSIHKERFRENEETGELLDLDKKMEAWACGLEVELSLKSVERYAKQFWKLQGLSQPMILFLSGGEAIFNRLTDQYLDSSDRLEKTIFLFADAEAFLNDRGEAPVLKFLGGQEREMSIRDINQIQVQVG